MRLFYALPFLVGCAPAHFGTYPDQLADFPKRQISPTDAVEAATPYLDDSYRLCREMRGEGDRSSKPTHIAVKLKGTKYYVLKDSYLSVNANYGFRNSVVVDAETGDVTPPEGYSTHQ